MCLGQLTLCLLDCLLRNVGPGQDPKNRYSDGIPEKEVFFF